MNSPFHTYRQFKRLYSIQIVTETGIYKDGEVPDSKSGDAQMTVQVVHELVMVDKSGKLLREVYRIPEALDKDDEVGGGYELNGSPYVTEDYPAPAGPSSVPTTLLIDLESNVSEDNVISANEMISIAGGWPPST